MKHYQPDWSEQPEEWHEPKQDSRLLLVRWLAVVITLVWIGAIFLFLTGLARAHEATDVQGYPLGWTYPRGCCNSAAESATGDCAPIASKYVTEGPDGYHIDLPVGSHPKLKDRGYSEIIPYGQERVSPEGNYHICLATNGIMRFCFFAGGRTG